MIQRVLLAACLLALGCGNPPAETKQAPPPPTPVEGQTITNGPGITTVAQEFSDCEYKYEIETRPVVRHFTYRGDTTSLSLGFWANCCGTKTFAAQQQGSQLSLQLEELGDQCTCKCCYFAFVAYTGIEPKPETLVFLGDTIAL